MINAKLFDIENKLLIEIEDNDWKVPNSTKQINFDNTAFEVIDEYNIPVIQIEVLDSNTIFIGGIFYYKDNLLIISDYGLDGRSNISRYYENETIKRSFISKLQSYQITKIFKYTGNYFGVRNPLRKINRSDIIIRNIQIN